MPPHRTPGRLFTLFDLLELVGRFAGLFAAGSYGHRSWGWAGLLLGGVIGWIAGGIAGRIPFALCSFFLFRNLRKCDTNTLRARLDREHGIAHLIIAELVTRGEPIESFREYVARLLQSESPFEREEGEAIRHFWPETDSPPQSPLTGPE